MALNYFSSCKNGKKYFNHYRNMNVVNVLAGDYKM